jgi:hypothetical protein
LDGRQFDSLTRTLAERTSRRGLIWKGAALGGALASLAGISSASAARRGGGGSSTSICAPIGGGSYARTTVPTVLLQTYLNQGYILSDCCAHAECGSSNACVEAFCDFGVGACSVTTFDGNACERPGCVSGTCSGGYCADPAPYICGGDGTCNVCTYDSCSHRCNCSVRPCYTDDYECMDAYCSPSAGGCVSEPINEGEMCATHGVEGICTAGYCTSA